MVWQRVFPAPVGFASRLVLALRVSVAADGGASVFRSHHGIAVGGPDLRLFAYVGRPVVRSLRSLPEIESIRSIQETSSCRRNSNQHPGKQDI